MAVILGILILTPIIVMIWCGVHAIIDLFDEPRAHRKYTKTIISYTYGKIPKEELPFSDTDGCSTFFKKGKYYPCHTGEVSFYKCLKDPHHKHHKRCRELFERYSLTLYYKDFCIPHTWDRYRTCPLRKTYLKRLIDWLVKDETDIKDKTNVKPKRSNIGYIIERVFMIAILSLVSIMLLSMMWSMVVDVWDGTKPYYTLLFLIMPGFYIFILVQYVRNNILTKRKG